MVLTGLELGRNAVLLPGPRPGRTRLAFYGDSITADLGRAVVGDRLPESVATDAPPAYRYPPGTTTVTWAATDAAGGTGTAVQHVVVRRR